MSSSHHLRPLDAFPAIRSRDPDAVENALTRIYGARKLFLPPRNHALDVHANHWQSRSIGLSYCNYGGRAQVEFPGAQFFRQQISLRGGTEIRIGGSRRQVTRQESSIVPPETPLLIDFPIDFEQLVLRVNVDPLMNKLAALIGTTPHRKLEFEPSTRVDETAGSLQRLLRYFINELDASESQTPQLALAELEQALIVSFLCSNRNNYSSFLEGSMRAPASWQVRRAEEYIHAHWAEPITIETLARETSTSARSLFHHFKRSRGHSPMDFVKQVRLQHAREMLSSASDDTSITETAFACGFGNLGHFAKDYLRRFGERPSDTLTRARIR